MVMLVMFGCSTTWRVNHETTVKHVNVGYTVEYQCVCVRIYVCVHACIVCVCVACYNTTRRIHIYTYVGQSLAMHQANPCTCAVL